MRSRAPARARAGFGQAALSNPNGATSRISGRPPPRRPRPIGRGPLFVEGGVFRTVRPSQHCLTHLSLLNLFLGTSAFVAQEGDDVWRIEVVGRHA